MAKTFAHESAYRGKDLIENLAKCKITICGAGTVGSNLTDTLCRQGVTDIRIIDMDRVETHNINTQIFGLGDVGATKVNAIKARMFRDVGVEIETFGKELTAQNAKKFLKNSTLVIDAFDNNVGRQAVRDSCEKLGIPLLHAGMYEDYGEIVWDEFYTVPQNQTEGDVCDYPLARNIAILVVTVAAEEVVNFCTSKNPRKGCWSITLKDLAVRPYR
jgi:molybdopterin-synthase adenylyltransferase